MKKILKNIIGINNIIKLKSYFESKKNPTMKIQLDRNAEFKNKYEGKRCFIIGNGPSIKSIDFSKLADEYTFTVNQLPRNPEYEKLNTNFHVWADERFFNLDEKCPEDMEILDVMKRVNTASNKPVVFYKDVAYEMVNKFHLDKELNIFYYQQSSFEHSDLANANIDFTKLVPGFGTVIHYIILLAVYMGFKEIILLGCDCTGIVSIAESRVGKAENSAYGYTISNNEKKRLEKVQNLTSFRDEMQWLVNVFDDYKILDEYCKKHGAKLMNATNPTLLEDVEKVKLEDVL